MKFQLHLLSHTKYGYKGIDIYKVALLDLILKAAPFGFSLSRCFFAYSVSVVSTQYIETLLVLNEIFSFQMSLNFKIIFNITDLVIFKNIYQWINYCTFSRMQAPNLTSKAPELSIMAIEEFPIRSVRILQIENLVLMNINSNLY